ncbi:hypothetical protein KVR01_001306 [Diaporthe batatas]|uniref:uncharacterized protein n=1 Tax=Diaporthe batatas TaxID=748121 RepID=UPI001D0473AC|nr:uncharacterized protein KVR01_001306 [Diaporthe batatas]KAG8168557.1 hypothetical protein KVR01_001306 [Diaporthe batatas]
MGIDSKKAPPLPAPTEESESTVTQTELAPSDVSKPGDDKSSYSLPEDGTPVTIRTRGHMPDRSQTSLLIEYFEAGKPSASPSKTTERKPSVRVRLTPSKNRKTDRIQITETKSSSGRKASLTRRQERAAPLTPAGLKSNEALSAVSGDQEDAKSMHSYTSATEESNVSRNPIEVEIDRGGHRRRRPASPLIPSADSKASYQPGNMSDISAIPTDSFLDGSGHSTRLTEKRSKSPSRAREVIGGAAAGIVAAAAADKMRSKSRGELSEKERLVVSKSKDRDSSERRHKSKNRKSSGSEHKSESGKSSRRKSSKTNEESILSGADSSVVSSAISHSHRSMDASSMRSGASRSSINNPKLLETVEDAIRRLILPELTAIKREQSKREARRSSVSSGTTASRDDLGSERRQSGYSSKSRENLSSRGKDRRGREARHDLVESPAPSVDHDSVDESLHEISEVSRGTDKLKATAGGAAAAAMAAAALSNDKSPAIAREQRRRRRAEAKSRASEMHGEEQERLGDPTAPMPLMSEFNPSDITRTSIMSADTERPHSASEELTPVQQVVRATSSIDSRSTVTSSPTPTRTPISLQALGAQHANISHGDLKTLSQKRTGGFDEVEYDDREDGRRAPISQAEVYDDEDEDEYDDGPYNDYYNTQDVPPPLKYVPYQPERRGLSPIPSVSGYTEGGSEIHNRESRLTHRTSGSFSSPDKSIRHGADSPSVLSRGSYQDDRSVVSSRLGYRNTTYTDDSELDRVTTGQAVRAVGANPNLVNSPTGVQSHVASLVEGSALDESVLTGESGRSGRQYDPRGSEVISEEDVTDQTAFRHKDSQESRRTAEDEVASQTSERPHEFEEYELDEYGRKVPRTKYRHSPTASEAAITGAAVGAAAAALRAAAKGKGIQGAEHEESASETVGGGVQRNKSFKDRTNEGYLPASTPTHSVDRLVGEYEKANVGHSGLPDANDPLPEIGYFAHDDDSLTNPSRMSDRFSATQEARDGQWQEQEPMTPTQQSIDGSRGLQESVSGQSLTLDEAAGAAAVATAAAMAHSHSRQASQDIDDEWRRTSEDRKRDTIVTNPYEGTSPLANAPGLDIDLGQAPHFDPDGYVTGYGARSPFGPKIDEGYISQGPNRTPDLQGKGKGIDYNQHAPMPANMDPFYNPQDSKHMSGLSQGMGSPLYDAATGAGIDRIESNDIIALMQHLMVRDAQRSARDTEILVTLVRTAAEMRNSFDDIKKMLADTEDVIITEVKENTDKTVQRHIGGPRPFPGSATRSVQGSQAGTENEKKTRNLWRRALKGLGAKGTNDLTRIEDMLMQLLGEVDVLKSQTAPGGISHDSGPSLDNIQPAVQYEQDHGYEPEGHAGTSTASYGSQSGHLSIPRNASYGYERKVSSGHRISTVPEGDEDDFNEDSNVIIHNHSNTDMLSPGGEPERGSSVPLGTPPQVPTGAQASLSNENTPRTENRKKHKSSGSASWFPKISRWSETTASSVGKAFRKSKETEAGSLRGGPSRSGSDFAIYENYPVTDPYGDDHLPSGYSDTNLNSNQRHDPNQIEPDMQFTMAGVSRTPVPTSHSPVQPEAIQPFPMNYSTPEDPKYKAHRNSLNLQHPQPRPGQTEQFRNALESSAQDFDTPMSPKSADFGSVTSLGRYAGHQPRYSNGSATGEQGQYTWSGNSPAQSGPPRPPKEPLEEPGPRTTTPTRSRISTLGYKPAGSPKPENRNLQNALGAPGRRPSGPRAMGTRSPAPAGDEERRKKRDTFGSVMSQESDTF